jgi:hypothetical protein
MGTNLATISGKTLAIGKFPAASVDSITMDTSSGVIKSQPSVLTTDGSSFTDAWFAAGP